MSWDMLKLIEDCHREEINLPDYLLPSIRNKFWRAHYFLNNVDNKFKSITNGLSFGDVDDEKFPYVALEVEADVEASMSAIDAIPDILAQVINVVLLNNQFSEGKADLYKVKTELSKSPKNRQLLENIDTFINSKEYKYIHSFVNTVKHRRLLEFELAMETGSEGNDQFGFRIAKFKYNDDTFDEMWVSELKNNFYNNYYKAINNIGSQINERIGK